MTTTDTGESGNRPRLRFLLDTNVIIAVEPFAGDVERGFAPAAEFLRLVNAQGHRMFVHPATRDDLLENRDRRRAAQRRAELAKFEMLVESPVDPRLLAVAGPSRPGTNDERDLRLLGALHARAVTYLVSDDVRLRNRARRADLTEAVLTIPEVVALLAGFEPAFIPPPPRVEPVPSYTLDATQAVFEGLRADYAGFDRWLDDKVRPDPDNRLCLLVRDDDGTYAAVALVKRREPDCAYAFDGPVSKITTFKVAEGHARNRYGELLLKAVLREALAQGVASLYVEVLPKHAAAVDFFTDFGFVDSGFRTGLDELVLVKSMTPPAEVDVTGDPLGFHVRYGPSALGATAQCFVVPIEPVWHDQLFPDAPDFDPARAAQMSFPGFEPRTHPWGNAIKKAYVCSSNATNVRPGDALLFYRSKDARAVIAVGVVERTLRSSDPDEVLSFVGGRTVYTPEEIAERCRGVRPVLAILFRQDRFVDPPWSDAELQQQGVIIGWPQSITQVRDAGLTWVRRRLGGSR